ncbi:uncharacterized protein LOC125224826 [Leguminivora glycinivorella]|uniref:uncharacterized protein LOC125224826 n=1 Tax=Leguminivora glycinivorella TaxID=1035111 RepID=UPI00200F3E12|nr:uncharacterized protein LOC125224826 [Leguminivora glycinivorella]
MATVIFVFVLAVLTNLSESYSIPYHPGNAIEDSWPYECKGRNYCWIQTEGYKNLQKIFDDVLSGQYMQYAPEDISDRDGDVLDVGNCKPSMPDRKKIYMIKDEDGTVWYVPHTANYSVSIQIEECGKHTRLTPDDQLGLNDYELLKRHVYCVEQRVDFPFPVLYQDGGKYGVKLMSPARGIPLSCSTKILKH